MLARDPSAYVIRAADPSPTRPAMPNHVTHTTRTASQANAVARIFAHMHTRARSANQPHLLPKMAAKRARAVLHTPTEALEANLEAQRAYSGKVKELQRRHEAEMEDLRREQAELKLRETELRDGAARRSCARRART